MIAKHCFASLECNFQHKTHETKLMSNESRYVHPEDVKAQHNAAGCCCGGGGMQTQLRQQREVSRRRSATTADASKGRHNSAADVRERKRVGGGREGEGVEVTGRTGRGDAVSRPQHGMAGNLRAEVAVGLFGGGE